MVNIGMRATGRAGRGDGMVRLKGWLVLLAIVGWASSSAAAQGGAGSWREVYHEGFGEHAHPLYMFQGVINFGPRSDTPWVASREGDFLVMSNDIDPGVVRYYFLQPGTMPFWNASPDMPVLVQADVWGEFGEQPGVGVVFRVDPANHDFHAFALTGGDGFGLFKRDQDGYRALLRDRTAAIVPGQLNRITVISQGADIHLFVNGEAVASYTDAVGASLPGLGMGIMAAGTGRYFIDEFRIALPSD